MMSFIKRALLSVVPTALRAVGGTFVTMVPTGAGIVQAAPLTLTAHATAAWKYGGVGAMIAATANTTECWIEGVVVSNATAVNQQYFIAITTATGITAAAQVLAEVPADLPATTDQNVIPLGQRIRIPPNVPINCALACSSAGKSADVQLIVSRQK
jgi:hypothetical protein